MAEAALFERRADLARSPRSLDFALPSAAVDVALLEGADFLDFVDVLLTLSIFNNDTLSCLILYFFSKSDGFKDIVDVYYYYYLEKIIAMVC